MYKNIVFDVYGTLIDIRTDEYDVATWQKMADALAFYDVNYTAEELKKAYFDGCEVQMRLNEECDHPEIDVVDVFRRIFETKNKKASKALATHLAQVFRAFSTQKLCLYDNVAETLAQLKKAKKKLYILSNAQRCFTRPELVKLGLTKYFNGIIYSSDYKRAKPSAELFEALLDKYRLNRSETVYVGNDPLADVDGAHNADIDCVWFKSNLTDPNAMPELDPEYVVCGESFAKISELLLK